MTLALLGNTLLRTAITRNLVSFPAQIQPFMKRASGDLQARIVQLYFVRGWSVRNICERYDLNKAMVHKLLAEWRIRAIESGYIQEVAPGFLDALVQEANQDVSHSSVPVPVMTAHLEKTPELRESHYSNAVPMQIRHMKKLVTLAAGSGV